MNRWNIVSIELPVLQFFGAHECVAVLVEAMTDAAVVAVVNEQMLFAMGSIAVACLSIFPNVPVHCWCCSPEPDPMQAMLWYLARQA